MADRRFWRDGKRPERQKGEVKKFFKSLLDGVMGITPELTAKYEQDKARMFQPVIVSQNERFKLMRTVVEVSHNEKGDLGFVVARNWRATARAVVRINKDMTLSKSGAKWTTAKWLCCNPRRCALVEVAVPHKLPDISKPASQQVAAMPVTILDMNTNLLPVITVEEWKDFMRL